MLDYRPTAKQRTTLEWFRYLAIMGRRLTIDAKAGAFDPDAWGAASKEVEAMSFEQVIAEIKRLGEFYGKTIGEFSDADFRKEVTFFGTTQSVGALFVNLIL